MVIDGHSSQTADKLPKHNGHSDVKSKVYSNIIVEDQHILDELTNINIGRHIHRKRVHIKVLVLTQRNKAIPNNCINMIKGRTSVN